MKIILFDFLIFEGEIVKRAALKFADKYLKSKDIKYRSFGFGAIPDDDKLWKRQSTSIDFSIDILLKQSNKIEVDKLMKVAKSITKDPFNKNNYNTIRLGFNFELTALDKEGTLIPKRNLDDKSIERCIGLYPHHINNLDEFKDHITIENYSFIKSISKRHGFKLTDKSLLNSFIKNAELQVGTKPTKEEKKELIKYTKQYMELCSM